MICKRVKTHAAAKETDMQFRTVTHRIRILLPLMGLALIGIYSTVSAFEGMTLYTARTWIADVDSTGRVRWRHEVGLPYSTRCSNAQRMPNGNLVLFGTAEPDPDTVSSVPKKSWPYLIVADEQGNELWARRYNFDNRRFVHGNDLSTLSDGGFLLAGMIVNGPRWVMRVRKDGSEVWRKLLGDSLGSGLVNVTAGKYLLTGQCRSRENKSHYRATLAELTPEGTIPWRREYGGEGSSALMGICATEDGYMAVGYTDGSFSEGQSAWIVKMDAVGKPLWEHKWRGGKFNSFSGIRQESSGYAAYGGADSVNVIVHYDTDGNELATEDLGSDQIKFIVFADRRSQPARMTRTQVTDSVSCFGICVDSSLCIPFEITRSLYQRSLLGNVFAMNRNEYVITGWTETLYGYGHDPTRLFKWRRAGCEDLTRPYKR
jgi:hypothetical protein